MENKHLDQARKVLNSIRYATIATVSKDGQPWNSPVSSYRDDQLNIYWASDKNSQHSRNIRDNESVFIVMYDSTVAESEGEGLYLLAKAYELTDSEEIRLARRLKKGPNGDDPTPFMNEHNRRTYKAIPQQAWVNDAIIEEGVFIRDFRVEIPLNLLRN